MIKIGGIIKAKRKEQDLTQEELASRLGVSKAAVSKWETAECYPDITLLPQLAKTFNITIDELFDYTKEGAPIQITNEYHFGLSLNDIDIAILDHGTVKSCSLFKSECTSTWEVRVHFISTEENIPYTIQKYMKTNILIDGYSVRLADGKPIIDNKANKHYICKEKVWEYHTTDHKYLKQMLREQIAMGLIEDDD
jgi:transcriptional regulator with XRE-family HTH domain